MNIGFDVISDLNLSPEDSFDWEDKATSLYCLVAGNISSDLQVINQTLLHLSKYYQGIFYCPGFLEYKEVNDPYTRTQALHEIVSHLGKVAILYHHVVVLNGIAVVGANGWYGELGTQSLYRDAMHETMRNEDIIYLKHAIERLQKHGDVKRIVILSSSVPSPGLYFGEQPADIKSQLPLSLCLMADTESKVTHWVFGTYQKEVDTNLDGINYVNNACFGKKPYWPKRLEISVS